MKVIINTDGEVINELDLGYIERQIDFNWMQGPFWGCKTSGGESTLADKEERKEYLRGYYQRIIKNAKRIEHKEYALNMLKVLL